MNRTDTRKIPVIDGHLADTTTEMRAPWLLPPVTATYRRPSRWHRFARSAFADDVRAGARRALLVFGVIGCIGLSLAVLRGAAVLALWLGLI